MSRGFAPIIIARVVAALLSVSVLAVWWIFGKDKGEQKVSDTESITSETSGEFPPGLIDFAVAFCREKVRGCEAHEGWRTDISIAIKNIETDAEHTTEDIRKGGCPGEYAGDSYPLNIKGETYDYYDQTYEIFCSATCYHWECGKDPTEKAVCPPGQFNDANVCIESCKQPLGDFCQRIGEIPPYCWECRKNCNLDVFAACASKCETPQECIERCPFIDVECPPGTPPDVVNCAELDESCSYGCLNTANVCRDACLQKSGCKLHEIPPELTPNPND